MRYSVARFPVARVVAVVVVFMALPGAVRLLPGQEDLDLPERIRARNEGLSLRRQELRPNVVVRPPVTTGSEAERGQSAGFGAGRLSWRFFTPDEAGIVEVAAEQAPVVVRTTPVELIRGIVLLPGETALELTGSDLKLVQGGGPAAEEPVDADGRAARAVALRRQIEVYTAGVHVAADFSGVRDHGTRPAAETLALLESLLGKAVNAGVERAIAETVILGFATSGRAIKDVIIIKDETVPGVFKVVILGGEDSGGS